MRWTLSPLIEKIEADVMASSVLHADDTPIRVLDRSAKKKELGKAVKQGRIWTYVRDQRPWSGPAPPGVVYYFSASDRKGEHPRGHLANSSGILQADAYAGFKELYERRVDGTQQFREAACWAHLRRDFHDVWTADKSQTAREALDRIGKLYDIEREIAGSPQPAETRLAARKDHSADKVAAFKAWAEQQLTRIPGKSDLAKAFRYALSRWASFTLPRGRPRRHRQQPRRARHATDRRRAEELALRRIRHRRRNPGTRHDPDREREDERPRPAGLPRRRPRSDQRSQDQSPARAAAVELGAQVRSDTRDRSRLSLQRGSEPGGYEWPEKGGWSTPFVNTLKRDHVRVTPLPDAETALGLIDGWFQE